MQLGQEVLCERCPLTSSLSGNSTIYVQPTGDPDRMCVLFDWDRHQNECWPASVVVEDPPGALVEDDSAWSDLDGVRAGQEDNGKVAFFLRMSARMRQAGF